MRKTVQGAALLTAGVLAMAGCGGEDGAAAATDDGVRTGPGITADTIALGVLTDLSGPVKSFGVTLQGGHNVWVEETNAAGGICGRRIELRTRDHGYKADAAVIAFPDLEPKVAGFLELVGSSVLAALRSDIAEKQITVMGVSYSSDLLDQPYVILAGTTYDLEMLNGLNWLLDSGKIRRGDKVGHVYVDGEYGGNGLRGAKYFARRHGIDLVEAKVTATDTDMKSIVTRFKGEKVAAIALSTVPAQTASVALNNTALGLDVPMIGNTPTFAPPLLAAKPVAKALENLWVAGSVAPYSSANPKAKQVATAFEKANPEVEPALAVNAGYANGVIWGQILQRACAAKDLSRAGIHAALRASDAIDVAGLVPDLDFSKPGSPSSRSVYIARVDPATPGGLQQVRKLYTAADATAYRAPKES